MISGRLCVSCYNRDREARIGRNCKGQPPRIAARLHVVPVAVIDGTGAHPIGGEKVIGMTEAMILAAKAAGRPMAFGRPRLDVERIAAEASVEQAVAP